MSSSVPSGEMSLFVASCSPSDLLVVPEVLFVLFTCSWPERDEFELDSDPEFESLSVSVEELLLLPLLDDPLSESLLSALF